MPSSKTDILTEEDVKTFVDAFYAQVAKDDLIGPVFTSRIKEWQPHLDRMYMFWSSILLGTGSYRGQPFPKHVPLGIGSEHFDRWLGLFEPTIRDRFEGKNADEAIHRAKSIGQIFAYKLDFLRKEGEGS